MADWNERQRNQANFENTARINGEMIGEQTTFDEGLRKHMLSIYNYMTSGVLLTGIVAMVAFSTGAAETIHSGALRWIVGLSPLAIVFAMSFGRNKFSTPTLQIMFWAFAVLMGLSLSSIFYTYTQGSIAVTFLATASAFAGLSLFGYTTKKDISGWGSFLIMGVIGLIVAMVANMFIQSAGLALVIPFLGVLIFAGLTAYDTQRLKNEYIEISQAKQYNPAVAEAYPLGKMVILGALTLYLDFINMFLFLLQFMGSRE